MNFRSFLISFFSFLVLNASLHAQKSVQDYRDELAAADEDFKKVFMYIDAAKKVSSKDPEAALEFAEAALDLSQKRRSREGVVQSHSYLGLLYVNRNNCGKAKENLDKAVSLKKQLIPKTPKYKKTISKDYRLMGYCEEKNGQDQAAVKSYQAGVRYAIESKNRFEYAWGMYQVGQLQNKLGDHATAVGALDKAIEQAQKLNLNNLVRNADRIRNASMAVLETKLEKEEIENEVKVAQQEIENAQQKIEEQQEFAEALVTEKELAEMERDAKIAEIELKAKELDKLELQNALIEAEKTKIEAEQQAQLERQEKEEERYILIGIAGGVVFLLTVLFMFGRIRSRRKHAKAIEEEKQKSEKLLYDVLPESIAKEILLSGKVRAKGYDEVSILFTDFKGFTKIAASLSPEKLVKDLDYAFEHFDQIVRKYGLEKIKTIGDAYMAAAGIPDKSKDHALDAVGVALEMQAFMQRWRTEKLRKGETPWELRIGINSGPVVAGVIGQHKFAYDIWGDAVNMASRMESSGEPGKINISARTQELIGKVANTSYRGKIEVKNAGAVDMYFVNDLLVKKNFQATTPKPQKKPWWRR